MTNVIPIRLKFTDFRSPFNPTRILKMLRGRFEIEVVDKEPDYVIFSVFGNEHLTYRDAVKIFFTGENLRPDFNTCDYAFAYDWMEFGDRYYRCPNYQLYEHFKEICGRRRSHVNAHQMSKKKFCNFVYTNRSADPYRAELFHALSAYQGVDSAGRYLNNVGFSPGTAYEEGWPAALVEFQRGYKFTIACENDSSPGYTTEKIVHALAADTIPIYFGNPLITREFNPKRFVNCHEFDSISEVVEYVANLDQDNDRCLAMMSEPFFIDDQVPSYLNDSSICDRFAHIFEQPKQIARRRSIQFWGWVYEEQRRHEIAAGPLLGEISGRLERISHIAPTECASEMAEIQDRITEWQSRIDLGATYEF